MDRGDWVARVCGITKSWKQLSSHTCWLVGNMSFAFPYVRQVPAHPKDQSWVFTGRTDVELKLQYFGHLMRRADSFEKTLMLGKIEGRRWAAEDEMC